jgi:hypothetical protein
MTFKGATLALLTLALPTVARAAERTFEATYAVSVKGIPVGDFNYRLKADDSAYQVAAERKTCGLARTLSGSSQDYTYAANGALAGGALRPAHYEHKGGKRNKHVQVAFGGGAPVTSSDIPISMGNPPATPAQKTGSVDQLTAIASMVLSADDPCSRSLKVFLDGRSRFDFQFAPNGQVNVATKAYRGAATRCAVQFRPIAGFPDPQEAATLTFLFAKTPSGMFAPLRIEMPTDDGLALLEIRSFAAATR